MHLVYYLAAFFGVAFFSFWQLAYLSAGVNLVTQTHLFPQHLPQDRPLAASPHEFLHFGHGIFTCSGIFKD
jgi:hypothetical protein